MSELIATIEQDFDFDLAAGENASWLSFKFRNLIKDNDEYRKILYNQFKELPATPKYDWYSQDRLANGYLTEDELWRWNNHHTKGILYDDVESKLGDLYTEFIKNKKSLDSKYNGRNLLHAPLIETLNEIGNAFDDFEKFVSSDKIVSAEKYAEAFVSEVIALTNRLNIPNLKFDIINKFINKADSDNIELSKIMQARYYNTDKLKSEYNKLKIYANKLLREEIEKNEALNTQNSLSATESAIKYRYLSTAKIEPYYSATARGASVVLSKESGKHVANIEKEIGKFSKLKRNNIDTPLYTYYTIKQLQNVLNSLVDYPEVQKAIENDIEKLS